MKNKIHFTGKRLVIVIVILILLLGMIFREKLIQTYVVVARKNLVTYAEKLLDNDDRQSDRYGFWKVKSYPEEQMVEFHTGGFGVAPSSTYIEQPYQGIYKTDTDIDIWAKKAENVLSEISKTIGVNVSAGKVISESDSHGGFHGDGDRVIAIQFSDTSFSDQIKDNEEWNVMPLTENLTALVYGLHTENSSIGPMIHDGDNVPVIPEIENGYYYFRDRHDQSTDPKDDTNVLSRASYNFSIVIFDADANMLYYMEKDT